MRIGRLGDRIGKGQLRSDLDQILKSDGDRTRVCGAACRKASEATCSPHCPDIPQALSSDPEKNPLETRIAPLVYELKRLGVFEPCWSCEGHNKPDGTLWKLPQVWFYCQSVVHLRVLADGIKELHVDGKLSVPWQISITFSDGDNVDTTFSLHPVVDPANVNLAFLQRDIDSIVTHLRDQVFIEALRLSRQVG